MNKLRCLLLFAFISLVPGFAISADAPKDNSRNPVIVAPLKGMVTEAQFFFLRRALKDAERGNAAAFIVDMDTPGGEVEAALKILNALQKTTVPTYTYINSNAGSAGAIIAMATRRIYMSPVSAIGAAAPITGTGEDLQATLKEKQVSYLSGYARSAAQQSGHNPQIAEAFINKEIEVKIGNEVINKKGNLLTLSAQEATRIIDGKPVLAAGIAGSVEELLKKEKLPSSVQRVEPTGFETVAYWITLLAPFFMLGGIIGAYLEFKTPGFGVPGVISIVCFIIFFTGHYLAGLAGLEVLAIFLLGVMLVLVDLILFPGTFLLGVTGAFLMIGSLLYAMIDRFPSDPWLPTAEMLIMPLVNLGIASLLAVVAMVVLAKFLPRTSLYNRIVLGSAIAPGASIASATMTNSLLGQTGVAKTALRPTGKGEFSGNYLDVVTQGDFIDAGDAIRIINADGMRVIVEKIS